MKLNGQTSSFILKCRKSSQARVYISIYIKYFSFCLSLAFCLSLFILILVTFRYFLSLYFPQHPGGIDPFGCITEHLYQSINRSRLCVPRVKRDPRRFLFSKFIKCSVAFYTQSKKALSHLHLTFIFTYFYWINYIFKQRIWIKWDWASFSLTLSPASCNNVTSLDI